MRPRLTLEAVYTGVTWSSTRGRHWRAPCPLHGGDNPQAFSVDTETLGWRCFTGQHRGDVLAYLNGGESPRGRAFPDTIHKAADLAGVALPGERYSLLNNRPTSAPSRRPPRRPAPAPEQLSAEVLELRLQALQRARAAFPDSPAAAYCESRGIPAELAARHGAGYAPSWKGKGPRVVFPLEAHLGQNVYLANLYARSLDSDAPPGYARHAYLPGPRGIFNAGALVDAEEVYVAEAVFDALALIAAGHPNSIALGGLDLPLEAIGHLKALHLCLDADPAAAKALHRLAGAAMQLGLRVTYLPPAALAGHKDLSAAWQATGHLDLGAEPPATALPADLAQKRAPTMPQEARDSPPAIVGPRVPASVAQAPYRPHHVTAPAWDAGTLALIARFEQSAPPAEPFRLGPGVTVAGPEKAWQAWRGDIATGPTGPRSRGALQADLARLAELQLI